MRYLAELELIETIVEKCYDLGLSGEDFSAFIIGAREGIAKDIDLVTTFEEKEEKDRKETERSLLWK